MNGIIYCATCTVTGKKYVGQTARNLLLRQKEHRNKAERTSARNKFYNAIRKYGWDSFEWSILESGIDNLDLLNERECHWIAEINSFKKGYNSTTGDINKEVSSETRLLLSEKNRGEKASNVILTEKQVYMIKQQLIAGATCADLGRQYNVSTNTINKVKSCDTWAFVLPELNDTLLEMIMNRTAFKKMYKPVHQLDMQGNILSCFENCVDASNKTGVREKSIRRVCSGERHLTGGYKWAYAI